MRFLSNGFFINGIITATITPFTKDFMPIKDGINALIDYQRKHGINAFFVLGTTGEGLSLSLQMRKKVAELFRDAIPDSDVMIVHVGSTALEDAITLAKHSSDIGADAISAVGPYFYLPDDVGLIKFYEVLAQATDLPLFVYNNPKKQGYNITPKIFEGIISNASNVVGLKDTSYDQTQLIEYVSQFGKNHNILVAGDSLIFETFALGAHGHVSAIANIIPSIVTRLYKSILDGDFSYAKVLQKNISKLRSILKSVGVEIAPYKAALEYIGIDAGVVLPPLRDLTEKEKKLIIDYLSTIDFEV